MKKHFFAKPILFLAIFISTSSIANAQYLEYWEIQSWHSDITVNQNGNVDVTEEIVADFSNEAHRGMLRNIPNEYANGYKSHIFFKEAYNKNDNNWTTKYYYDPYYLNIEVRHPENQLTNEKVTFIFKYRAENVVNFFESHDEFSWNVNGTDFPVAIKKLSAKLTLPEGFKEDDLNLNCFTGQYGSTETNCQGNFLKEISPKPEQEQIENQKIKIIQFNSTQPLLPYENLSIGVAIPANSIQKPDLAKKAGWIIRENKGIFLIPTTFLVMLALWYFFGRDDKAVKDTVMPHYQPPEGLTPSETGTIYDEEVHPQDISATIIDYAIKGYIKIHEIKEKKLIGSKTDYELELIKPYETTKDFEILILKAVFETNQAGEKIKISELRKGFGNHVVHIRQEIIKQLIKDGHFPHNPHHIRAGYTLGGGAIIFLIMASGLISLTDLNIFCAFFAVFSITFMSKFMPRKTKKGTDTYYKLRGLYEYINTAEKDRLKFQEDSNIIFEKLLPYAMAFGIVEKWTGAFEGILKTPPTWFISPNFSSRNFNIHNFSHSLSDMGSAITQSLQPPGSRGGSGSWSGGSSFGGGGFSGGGFGGGGGRGL